MEFLIDMLSYEKYSCIFGVFASLAYVMFML